MAGNSKARRKPGKVHPIDVMLAKAKRSREQRIATKNARLRHIDSLPLGHPMNAGRVDKVFRPLERVLDEQEKSGTMLFDQDGNALMWDEIDQDFMLLVPGLVRLCAIFDWVGDERGWERQPPGLRALAYKLADKRPLDQDADVIDARASVAWMRDKVATISPADWTDLHDRFVAMEQNEKGETN